MLKKIIFLLLVVITFSYGGLIGLAVDAAKDKAVNATKKEATDIYKQRKEIRREKESITGKKSNLSKIEDKVEHAKNKVNQYKTLAKETAVDSIGRENIETLKKGKNQIKNELIGKPIYQ